MTYVNNDGYSSTTKFRISSLCVHDNIYNFGKLLNKLQLVDSTPTKLAHILNGIGFVFTVADTFDDGSYVPLPNISLVDIVFLSY